MNALLRDPRDLPVLRLTSRLLLLLVPTAVALFAAFHPALALAHLLVVFHRGSSPFAGLIHEVSHRPIFSPRWLRLGRASVEWVLCPFFGLSPYAYWAQHVGMHHPENNLLADGSATIGYRRDSPLDFVRYLARFLFLANWELLLYLRRSNKRRIFRRAAVGMAAHHAAMALALALSWRAALVVFVVPYVWIRIAFAIGNWAQHGFVDASDPSSCYRNTITCLSDDFNRATFNSGYHISHHEDLRVHWSELPARHAAHRRRYLDERAIVFEGLDYGQVFLALMLGRFGWLAAHHAPCGDDLETIAARLEARTGRVALGFEPGESSAPLS